MKKMNISKYLKKMKKIQENVLDFIDDETNDEENFIELKNNLIDLKICNNKHIFKSFLHYLTQISNDHHRAPFLFIKIEQILKFFQKDIKNIFSNSEIFNIFKRSKKLLLSLLEEKIIIMDDYIASQIITTKYIQKKYPQYFWPEIRPFLSKKWFVDRINENEPEFISEIKELIQNLPKNFYEKRKKGENDRYICEMIQNDSVEKFIAYINENKIRFSSRIQSSIYETNNFFLKNENPSLFEYSAFYGSIQIFKFLLFNKVKISLKSWFCAIHSRNPEIIHILEENKEKLDEESIKLYLKESIKCHHNDFLEYFQTQYFEDEILNTSINGIKYYNFDHIQNIKISMFYYLCKYDYYILANILIKKASIDINQIII